MIPSILSILILFSGSMGYFYFYDKKTFNDICFTISFNCIYCFSYVQIKCNQVARFIQYYIQKISKKLCILENKSNKRIEFVKNGVIIYEGVLNENNKNMNSICIPNDYDFVIWMNNDENNTTLHKMFESSTELNNLNWGHELEHVFYKFINSEIIINDTKKFNIHFKTDKYNYLMKDNVINKEFIIYFLNKHYKEYLGNMTNDELNNMKYKINIIDHNVNCIELENDKVLKFNKHNYEISNNTNNTNE